MEFVLFVLVGLSSLTQLHPKQTFLLGLCTVGTELVAARVGNLRCFSSVLPLVCWICSLLALIFLFIAFLW